MKMQKRGKEIDKKILNVLKGKERPASTREISLLMKVSWHTVINHCLRLQLSGEIDGYKIGNLNVWFLADKTKKRGGK